MHERLEEPSHHVLCSWQMARLRSERETDHPAFQGERPAASGEQSREVPLGLHPFLLWSASVPWLPAGAASWTSLNTLRPDSLISQPILLVQVIHLQRFLQWNPPN